MKDISDSNNKPDDFKAMLIKKQVADCEDRVSKKFCVLGNVSMSKEK